jgi:ketosteroid isomerase-like protein
MRIALMMAALLALACGSTETLTAEEEANLAALRSYEAAYNAQEEGWQGRLLAEDFTYHGFGPSAPQGKTANRGELIVMMEGAARMFPDRTVTISNLIAAGDTVVMEMEWVGTVAGEHPVLKPGDQQRLRGVAIYRFRDGEVVEMREYVVPMAP